MEIDRKTAKRTNNRLDSFECDLEKKKFKANENEEDFHCDEDWADDSDFENFGKQIFFGLYFILI